MGKDNQKQDNEKGILWFSDFAKMKDWLQKNSKDKHDYKVFSLFGLKNLNLSDLKVVLEEYKSFFQGFEIIDLSETIATNHLKKSQDQMVDYLEVMETLPNNQFAIMNTVDRFMDSKMERFKINGDEEHDKQAVDLQRRLRKVIIEDQIGIEFLEGNEQWQKSRDRLKEVFPNIIEFHKAFFKRDLSQQLIRFHEDRKEQVKFEFEAQVWKNLEKQYESLPKDEEQDSEEDSNSSYEPTEHDLSFAASLFVDELKREKQAIDYDERRKKRIKMGLD